MKYLVRDLVYSKAELAFVLYPLARVVWVVISGYADVVAYVAADVALAAGVCVFCPYPLLLLFAIRPYLPLLAAEGICFHLGCVQAFVLPL